MTNKCSGCLQKLEAYRNSLANRKDWEVKAKIEEQKQITYWENAYNNPKGNPCSYNCSFGIPSQGLGGTEYGCDKCKQMDYLEHNEYGDCPPHICKQKKCSQCNSTFVEPQCPTCEADKDRRDKEQEKQALELQIVSFQQALKAFKHIPKNHPSYNEYQKQQLEKQLTEAIRNYKSKYGELPSSLREDVGGGGWKPLPKWKELYTVDSSSDDFVDCYWSSCLFLIEEKGKK